MKNIAIIGSGSFGCALAYILSKKKDNNIKIWSYKKEESDLINNEHKSMYLEDLILDENIKCYTNYEEALIDSEYIIIATPSKVVRQTCIDMKKYIKNQQIIIASKGLEEKTNKILSDVVKEELPQCEISVISGPSHANQIINDMITVIEYSGDKNIKELFETDNFKLEYNEDMIGIQIGGALKNVVSIASGIFEGLGYDTNTLSFIITKGLNEIKEIGVKLGAKESTFYNLSGLGDLLTTSIGNDSRNKRAGILLSKGKKKYEIQKEIGMVIEGFDNIDSSYNLMIKYNLDLNLIKNLYNLLNDYIDINEFVNNIKNV